MLTTSPRKIVTASPQKDKDGRKVKRRKLSAEKLLEYQSEYFEDELIQKKINDVKIYNILDGINKIENFKIIKE